MSIYGSETSRESRPKLSRPSSSASSSAQKKSTAKVFKYKCTYSATVTDTLKRRGWVEADENSDDWDVFFCDMLQLRDLFSGPSKSLEDHQRVAHFRNCFEISRKHLMVKNLKRLKYRIEKCFGKEESDKCDFYPTTFVLPMEHRLFIHEFRNNPGSYWIIKPAAGAQGRGIFIFQRLKDYLDWRSRFDIPDVNAPLGSLQRSTTAEKQLNSDGTKKLESILKFQTLTSLQATSKIGLIKESIDIGPDTIDSAGGDTKPDSKDFSSTKNQDDATGTDNSQVSGDSSKPEGMGVPRTEIYVVQRYIMNPYLIGGRKFDIRFFVLVTSYAPLKAYIYRDGFARFSNGQFSLKSLQDIYVHLTNVAIQKTSENYNAEKGSKWSLRCLREYLVARHSHGEVQDLMNQIDNIVIRTLQSVQQQMIQDRHCFEIYGFDVLIDENLRPWLLEVNASPAFTPSNEEDYRLKCALIDDTIHVLDLEGRLTGFEKRIGGYDLLWNLDGPVYANAADSLNALGPEQGLKLNSFLGCFNNRHIQLHEIFANAKFIRDIQKIHFGPHLPIHHDTTFENKFATDKDSNKQLHPNGYNGFIKDDRFRLPGQPYIPNFDGTGLYLGGGFNGIPKLISRPKLPPPIKATEPDGFVVSGKALLPKTNNALSISYVK